MTPIRKASHDDPSISDSTDLKGLWWPAMLADGRKSATFSCPGCGSCHSLSRWTIAPDGTVSPSVDHSQPIRRTDGTTFQDCTFHDHIKLEGWVP